MITTLTKTSCLDCGAELTNTPNKKQRKYCDDLCRGRWFRATHTRKPEPYKTFEQLKEERYKKYFKQKPVVGRPLPKGYIEPEYLAESTKTIERNVVIEDQCCSYFGCGRILSMREKLFGSKCIDHSAA